MINKQKFNTCIKDLQTFYENRGINLIKTGKKWSFRTSDKIKDELKKEKYFQHNKLKDYYVMNQIRVKDVQKQHTTEVTFESLEVDTGINPALFQEKNLKRIPKN